MRVATGRRLRSPHRRQSGTEDDPLSVSARPNRAGRYWLPRRQGFPPRQVQGLPLLRSRAPICASASDGAPCLLLLIEFGEDFLCIADSIAPGRDAAID